MTNEKEWVDKRFAEWQRLELMTRQAGSRKRLTGAELVEMMTLYRKASADLAMVRGESANPELAYWLNNVVSKAYSQLYRAPRVSLGRALTRAVWQAADTVRRRSRPILFATVLFFAMALAAVAVVSVFPQAREVMVPGGFESSFDSWKAGTHPARTSGESIAASGFYLTNNTRVAILTNALTVATAGLWGINALWQNGGILGILAKEVSETGQLGFLIGSILPHGVSEIGGIFIACGAGFLVAMAGIRPGRLSRFESIRRAGRDAGVLMLLSIFMIVLSAPIEGFFSFNPSIPLWVKYLVGFIHLAAWMAFFTGFGQKGPPEGTTYEQMRPEPLDTDPDPA